MRIQHTNLDLYSILKQINAYNNRSQLDVKPRNTYLGIYNIYQWYFVTNGGMFIDIIFGDENKPDQCIFYFLRIKPEKEL